VQTYKGDIPVEGFEVKEEGRIFFMVEGQELFRGRWPKTFPRNFYQKKIIKKNLSYVGRQESLSKKRGKELS
jgi:hypothetical protein